MNSQQRGVYQPLTENLPIYDLADDDQDDEEERSRLPILIVFALLVLAAFAGVVWLAYNQGVARGRAGSSVVIAAPEGPARTAPAEAGGADTPYTGLKVYNQPLSPDQEAQNSTLAPAPAVDLPPAAPAEPPPVRLNPPAAAQTAPAPRVAATYPPAAKPAPQAAAKPPAAAAKPVPAASAPGPAALAPQIASAAPSASRAPAALTQPPAPVVAAKPALGGAVLQIGSFTSEALAGGAWTTFKTRYADIAANSREDIQKVDLGAKGIWYRLRIGPYADRDAASGACAKLKAEGGNCFVSAP